MILNRSAVPAQDCSAEGWAVGAPRSWCHTWVRRAPLGVRGSRTERRTSRRQLAPDLTPDAADARNACRLGSSVATHGPSPRAPTGSSWTAVKRSCSSQTSPGRPRPTPCAAGKRPASSSYSATMPRLRADDPCSPRGGLLAPSWSSTVVKRPGAGSGAPGDTFPYLFGPAMTAGPRRHTQPATPSSRSAPGRQPATGAPWRQQPVRRNTACCGAGQGASAGLRELWERSEKRGAHRRPPTPECPQNASRRRVSRANSSGQAG
jgi:hypothetical protein